MGSNFMDELDCGSFFDHIDDLIDFPPENECVGAGSGDCKNFPSIWNDPLPDSEPLFSGSHHNSASDLSAELSVPVTHLDFLEFLHYTKCLKISLPLCDSNFSALKWHSRFKNCLINFRGAISAGLKFKLFDVKQKNISQLVPWWLWPVGLIETFGFCLVS